MPKRIFTGGNQDIFVRNLAAGSTAQVSVGTNSLAGTSSSYSPTISSNGQLVAFASYAATFSPLAASPQEYVFVRDVVNGTNRLVSINFGGTNSADSYSQNPQLTPDGRCVVFTSQATNLTLNGDTNIADDVFVRDTAANTTMLVSVNAAGTGAADAASDSPVISSDGRYVTFQSLATDLMPGAFSGSAPPASRWWTRCRRA